MDFNTFKQIVIAKAEVLGLTEYELYYQSEESTSVSAFKHEINQFTSSREGGVCFRCIVNGKTFRVTNPLNLSTQNSAASGVEGHSPNIFCLRAKHIGKAFFQLICSFVGKGDGDYRPGCGRVQFT